MFNVHEIIYKNDIQLFFVCDFFLSYLFILIIIK